MQNENAIKHNKTFKNHLFISVIVTDKDGSKKSERHFLLSGRPFCPIGFTTETLYHIQKLFTTIAAMSQVTYR